MHKRYTPFLAQSYHDHFPKVDKPFELDGFLEQIVQPAMHYTVDAYRTMLMDSVMAMSYQDREAANQFVEDCLPQLGMTLAWQLCHLFNLTPCADKLAGALDSLRSSIVVNHSENQPLPHKLFLSSIYMDQPLHGLKSPDLNPLLLKIILHARDDYGLQALKSYLSAYPVTASQADLIKLVPGYRPEIEGLLSVNSRNDQGWSFLVGLSELEFAGMVDADEAVRQFKSDRKFGGVSRKLIRGYYEPSYSRSHYVEVVQDLSQLASMGMLSADIDRFMRESLMRVLAADRDQKAQKLLISGLTGNEESIGFKSGFYRVVLGAVLDSNTTSTIECENLLNCLLDRLRDKAFQSTYLWAVSNGLFIPKASGQKEPEIASSGARAFVLGAKSDRSKELLGDIALLAAKHHENVLVMDVTLKGLVDGGILSVAHLKELVKSARGRKVCANANLSKETLVQLPKRFLENQLSTDLGL